MELRVIPEKTGILKNKRKLRFFSNAREVTCRIYTSPDFDSDSNRAQYVQIRLEEPISCRFGDRFIVRDLSPVETIGGGRIIAPFGNRNRKNKGRLTESLEGLASKEMEVRIAETVFLSGTKGVEAHHMPPLVDCGQKQIQKILSKLASQGELVCVNTDKKKFLHRFHCKRIAVFFVRTMHLFHQNNPEKQGASGSDFFGKMSRIYTHQEIISALKWAVKHSFLVKTNDVYHLPDFQGGLNEKQTLLKKTLLDYFRDKGFQPPGIVNLSKELSLNQKEVEKILKIGHREKWIVRANDDLWYHPEIFNEIKEKLVVYFSSNEKLTVIEFKDLLGISRKHAIGLLEYFDGLRLTRRIENYRISYLDGS